MLLVLGTEMEVVVISNLRNLRHLNLVQDVLLCSFQLLFMFLCFVFLGNIFNFSTGLRVLLLDNVMKHDVYGQVCNTSLEDWNSTHDALSLSFKR